ncbi:hypothetical protein M422DRAFT_274543 [Sphaerobolus stellatus SS14]|uniref:Uncharacterized protein n=1 Tax=Sphaerobolus stellatus (strain SS14) TaxID=990650 RepID=A0A0C9T6R2_SPHS4|nr:hypothetical protein M422DRAFT_274543 [Sphaerobolus stellatus SS14]
MPRSQTEVPRSGIRIKWTSSLTQPLRNSKALDEEDKPSRENIAGTDKYPVMNNGTQHIVPHADLAEQWHTRWEQRAKDHESEEGVDEETAEELAREDVGNEKESIARRQRKRASEVGPGPNFDIANKDEMENKMDEDRLLTERVLELAISLEWRARNLLIAHLGGGDDGESGGGGSAEGGRAARIILKADRNVQLRIVKRLLKEMECEAEGFQGEICDDEQEISRGIVTSKASSKEDGLHADMHPLVSKIISRIEHNPHAHTGANEEAGLTTMSTEKRTLEEVRLYREEFAGLLAAGSRLMKLKGMERSLFERRRVEASQ